MPVNEEYTISYSVSANELAEAHMMHWKINRRKANLIFSSGMIILALYGIWRINTFEDPTWGRLVTAFGITMLFARTHINRWALIRHYRKRKDHENKATWVVSEVKLIAETEGLGKSELDWNGIHRVNLYDFGFAVYQTFDLFYVWPKRSFKGQEELEAVEKICRNKVQEIHDYRKPN